MTLEEAELWEQHPIVSSSWPSSPCMDCTLAFHQEQVALGLCDGTPQGNGRPRLAETRERALNRERQARWRARQA